MLQYGQLVIVTCVTAVTVETVGHCYMCYSRDSWSLLHVLQVLQDGQLVSCTTGQLNNGAVVQCDKKGAQSSLNRTVTGFY